MVKVKEGAKFKLGRCVSTPGAMAAFQDAGETPFKYLGRHLSGDWGIVCAEDKQANEDALRSGARILSAYRLMDGTKLWIITEAESDACREHAGEDDDCACPVRAPWRESTCIMLPEEY